MGFKTIEELMEYSKKIIGKSINDVADDNEKLDGSPMKRKKGVLGNLVETEFFHYPQNNNPAADFEDLGVELKITGIVETKNGYKAKERMVLSMINFMDVAKETFEESHLLEKNQLILILWYHYIKGINCRDYKFKYILLYSLLRDKKIIEHDYNIIRKKVLEGKAHELSEGDTTYLGACRKGRTGSDTRPQPYSDIPAPSRAFCLKNSYMTLILNELINNKFVLNNEQKVYNYKSVLEYVESKLKPYYNKTQFEIIEELNVDLKTKPKNLNKIISDRLIGKDSELKNIDDMFKYSTYIIKNSPIFGDNRAKERMSFRNLTISEFNEKWDDSDWKHYFEEISIINIRYHFEKSNSKNGTGILQDVIQFSFTDKDLDSMEKTYNMVKDAIEKYKKQELGEDIEDYIKLLPTPKSFEGQILEILPKTDKGKRSYDTLFKNEGDTTKVAFALNKDYLNEKYKNN
ncbi:MAG: hypothetical protein E7Z75_09150 [Methanobrevibacter olleyae]|uniref:DNA mismatch repair MutH/Type II restriction enzyme Sau3AI domain-containing protein n=1 Tax=Methanobrevibacter olleyae TaxID=294671 RepID=A0A8T3W013_METOL|nr:hypothetical protein [Methanobrevibacter olleyae]